VGVDRRVRPVRERVEEARPAPGSRVLQRETTGAPTVDDRQPPLVSRIAIGLEERVRGGAGNRLPTDEAVIGLLPEHQLGLVDGLLPGSVVIAIPTFLSTAGCLLRLASSPIAGSRSTPSPNHPPGGGYVAIRAQGKGVGDEGGRGAQTLTMGVS